MSGKDWRRRHELLSYGSHSYVAFSEEGGVIVCVASVLPKDPTLLALILLKDFGLYVVYSP